ncbi:hypothetical protein SAY86_030357 [Trapa natans]|uniref:Histone deacetylase interacting domain-containing protein n=1 Tax=Trapa natans TaxID=22666 RepID=A0AAN7RH23_TRANT|nr:hypothetical protein SAY86_030357 [Trapa natans]
MSIQLENNGLSQVPGGGGGSSSGAGDDSTSQTLTTNDAMSYLKEVKDMFQDQREKYDTFLEVMKDFKAQRTDTAGVITRVKELFKGHNSLLLGFNTFLPKGYVITIDEDEVPTRKTVEFEEAISFVNKIKKRFQNDEHVYKAFLDILNLYRKEHKDINEVYHEVAELFDDHPDLLEEFMRFLPDNSGTTATHNVPFNRNSFRPGERTPAKLVSRPLHMDKHRNRPQKITGSHADRGSSVDRPDVDDDKSLMKIQKDQKRHPEKDISRSKRNVEVDDREFEHDNRDFNLHHIQEKRKDSRKSEGIRASFPFNDDKDALKGMYTEGIMFCEKVKERLCSADDYQAFLKLLNIYSHGIIKRNDLQNLVTDLLGKHPDLMYEFNEFLERCENIDGFLAGVMNKKSLAQDSPSHKLSKVDHKHEAEGKKDKIRSEYLLKSIQELDLSDCQRCTPSYRLLPDDYPIPSASQRSELGAQVLNDHWVSVTSGSEDYSFKHMRRNQYEDSLFRCEDDRFELDMLIESVSSTAKRVEEFLNSINQSKNNIEASFQVENHFSALHLRCIERLYGDHGLDVLDILRRNPNAALPVILIRLKQKQEEWTKCRTDFNKVWADVYAKNHYKSLDHRSFYFKQQDPKNLSTKSLVAEIKELKEKQQKEDDLLQAIASVNRPSCSAHLEFPYIDLEIHEDLYKVFLYSCEEICSTKEQLNKVMRLWTTFLEPMLGVSSRTHGKGVIEVGKTSRGMANSSTLLSRGESRSSPEANIPTSSLKQLKSDVNKYDNRSTLSTNGDASVKERSSMELDRACKDVSNSNSHFQEKELKGRSVAPSNSVVPGEVKESKVNANNEASALSKLMPDTFVKNNNEFDGHTDNSAEPLKSEKEEGELSPLGDFEENFVDFKEDNVESVPEVEHEQEHQSTNGEGGGGMGSDANDEDSENNISDRGEVSGSDECFHEEENEEEEEADHDEVDGKAESEGEHDGHGGAEDGSVFPISELFLSSVKPLSKWVHADQAIEKMDSSRIFYANDDFYALFRLHQTLYERVLSAKTNSDSIERQRNSEGSVSPDPYSRFMAALYNLLDGTIDNSKFEDECRAIIGNQSYILFTLDKLIYKLVKQLQLIASDDMDNKLLQLYEYEKARKGIKFNDSVYYENVRVFLHGENIYRMKFSVDPPGLSIQLMGSITEKPEVFAVSIEPNFCAYLLNDFLSALPSRKDSGDIYMQRNKRKYSLMDENLAACSALEGIQIFNGLECKIACISSKISYVFDTEDFFFRPRSKRRGISREKHSSRNLERVERFHRFLSAVIAV